MQRMRIKKYVSIPDRKAMERLRKVPELGPNLLFFSGGTAIKRLSQEIINYSHNTTHVITPFDSGGSSAELRNEFGMLSIGDIRNRLMALADQSYQGNPEIYRLFAYRFSKSAVNSELADQLAEMIDGVHPLVAAVMDPLRKIIRNHLQYFQQAASASFDLRGASIGNLILAGGYLNNRRHIDPVIYLFSKLVEARGVVRPSMNCDHQLAARLSDGTTVVGQHLLTGKEVKPITSAIEELYLVDSFDNPQRVQPQTRDKIRNLIGSAELICYPPGSFYSSVIANFLPGGICDAIADNPVLKVYVPNLGKDPEQRGMKYKDSINFLIKYLQKGCESSRDVAELINYVIIDSAASPDHDPSQMREFMEAGIKIIDTPLADPARPDRHDPVLLAEVLLSLT